MRPIVLCIVGAGGSYTPEIVEGVLGWGAESDAATISVHVSNARAKLKAAGAEPVQTVWGVGYKWIA